VVAITAGVIGSKQTANPNLPTALPNRNLIRVIVFERTDSLAEPTKLPYGSRRSRAHLSASIYPSSLFPFYLFTGIYLSIFIFNQVVELLSGSSSAFS